MFILIHYLTSFKSLERAEGHCEVRILTVHAILCGAKALKVKLFLFIQIENLFSF